jgi:hypothetical protein
MREAKGSDFNWWLPVSGAVGAVILLMPTLIWGNDAGAFFASIPLAVLIAVILLAVALTRLRRQSLAVVAMICIFMVLVFSLFRRLTISVQPLAGPPIRKATRFKC